MLKYIDIVYEKTGKVIFYFKGQKSCLNIYNDIILPCITDKKLENFINSTEKIDLYNIVAQEFINLPNNIKDYEFILLHISGRPIKTYLNESKELKYLNKDNSLDFNKDEGYVIEGKNSKINAQEYRDKMEQIMYNIYNNIEKYLDFFEKSLITEEDYLQLIK
ncbi:MAG TPA: hypothetical protein PKD00_01555 [Burkholderiales bacterium]|nr:hypothetical protein [Burkholderiales bacterium]